MRAKPQPAGKGRLALALPQKIRIGFSIGIALYVVVWGFATWSLMVWGRDINSVVGANQALTQIERVLSSVENAETGQRGYLLTGDPAYLKPYEAARARLDVDLARVGGASLEDPVRDRRISHIRELAGAKLRELAGTVALADSGHAGDAHAARSSGMRQNRIQQLRSSLGIRGEAALNQRDGPGEHHAVPSQNTLNVLVQRQPSAARSERSGGARHEWFSSRR